MPWFLPLVVFCIIVRAGALNPAEITVLQVIMANENQKLFEQRQQSAVRGNAIRLEIMQIEDLAVSDFFSNLSLKIPPITEAVIPPIVKDRAFATAKESLKSGYTLRKYIGKYVAVDMLPKVLIMAASVTHLVVGYSITKVIVFLSLLKNPS